MIKLYNIFHEHIICVQLRKFYELKICKLRVLRYLINFRDVICVVSNNHAILIVIHLKLSNMSILVIIC